MIGRKNHKKPLVLLILDGWGIAPPNPGNPIALVGTPHLDLLAKNFPSTQLIAHGRRVGLPSEQVGNSEAGHMNLGAGRTVLQDTVIISRAINDGTFFKNPALNQTIVHVKKNHSYLHLMGMISRSQSPHADPDHLLALLSLARNKKIKKVYLHLFTDGRDSPKYAALKIVEALIRILKPGELIGTIIGRFYAMDRKKEWARTEKAFNALVLGQGLKAKSPQAAITQAYNREESDEFIPPYIMVWRGKIIPRIKENDAVIFFNLRSDRARQMAKPFVQPDFNQKNPGSFRRKKVFKNLYFVAMTDFGPDLGNISTAFPSRDLTSTLPMILASLKQLYLAEREKYAHVTYFFNGGYPDPVVGEDRQMIESPKVDSYDKTPGMASEKITQTAIKKLKKYDFITVNYACPDMVGHTGNLEAAKITARLIDKYVWQLSKEVLKKDGTLMITADHGNMEQMIDLKTGEVDTEHSTNPVPFILVTPNQQWKRKRLKKGILGDVAPTVLKILGLPKPKLMTGKSLI